MNLVFQFQDVQSFLWMDGHGPYVWSCYIITFAGIIFLAFEPRMQRKKFIKKQRQISALRQRQNSEQPEGSI